MADRTSIEWTRGDDGSPGSTWNPIRGTKGQWTCTKVSPGCTHCYAERLNMSKRHGNGPAYVVGADEPRLDETIFRQPLRWRRPRRIFVCSMSDLFMESVPDEWIDRIFAVMALAPQHTFQVLTKRAERMREYVTAEMTPFRIARAMDAFRARRDVGQEEVLPIAGYPGYFASSHGFIYSERRGKRRKMSPDIGDQGHQRVQLYKGDRVADRLSVHRLILETFIGPAPSPDAQGRHRDGVPSNNALSNLTWGDQGENWDDAKRHGTHRRYSKLAPDQAAKIRRRHEAGETGEALAREFDVSATQIRNIARGLQWATATPIEWPLPGVWLGVSAERQQEADKRTTRLLQTPAVIRFVSLEPLLGPIDLTALRKTKTGYEGSELAETSFDALRGNGTYPSPISGIPVEVEGPRLNLVIVGGESGGPPERALVRRCSRSETYTQRCGSKRFGTCPACNETGWEPKPEALAMVRSLRDQCVAAGVAFHFKQWGGPTPKSGGRLLDGREWDEMPRTPDV